ncbi:hypothetical protein [Streptomyces sp. NBC_00687]|uniref:hypothetical protein n=1 Tax=Streptomyces sp. NBC_00687 TaxID=2975807 RepID=UPI002259CBF1|nr:hypothetical protein [Streptomyces sp. NBC_00687]MCX4912882.1 hypothetical protein [Streptomyces sp. NBC_00687]
MDNAGDFEKERDERVHALTTIVLQQRGHSDAAGLLVDAPSVSLKFVESDWGVDFFELLVDVDPSLVDRFTEEVSERILTTAKEVTERDEGFEISSLRVRPILPEFTPNWRTELKTGMGPKQSNHAHKVRSEPNHPTEGRLHFTNEWEHKVYAVLRDRQAQLEDNETIGIVPLALFKVATTVLEPDLLVTYRGYAGVIEVDGPHHKDRASSDKGRDRLLLNAGVKFVERIDVRDTTTKEEVEKFVTDFLKRLVA